jgi:acyl dehydratase
VRFPSPVPVGSKLRLGAKLLQVEDVAGGAQVTMEFTFEIEGAPKPSCVAEVVFRYYS